jgi:catechol 2,3-dioxygenase-like lactoylglutathione lyase family enzyme
MKLFSAIGFALAAGSIFLAPARAQLAAPNEAGIRMGHVHLNVTNAEAYRKLFVDHFGASLVEKGRLRGVKLPGMLIFLREQAPTGGSEGTVLDHFGFKVPSRAETVKRWREAGLEVQREFTGTEGFPNAYIVGPDGLRIELQEDTTLTAPVTQHLHWYLTESMPMQDWYANTLGFARTKRGTHPVTADVPGINLTFMPSKTPGKFPTKGRVLDHIGFEVRNLEAFCRKIEAAGVKFDVPYRKVPELGLGIAFLTDPLGTYIELTEGLDQY